MKSGEPTGDCLASKIAEAVRELRRMRNAWDASGEETLSVCEKLLKGGTSAGLSTWKSEEWPRFRVNRICPLMPLMPSPVWLYSVAVNRMRTSVSLGTSNVIALWLGPSQVRPPSRDI